MASPRLRRLRNYLLTLAILGLGLWLAGSALWQLGCTAVFVHESVVVTGTVTDMRRRPFESWAETLGRGNWSWPGDVSYQPTVRFTLPGGIDAIRIDMDLDNVDYETGQQVSIISPPGQPGKAHLNRWKFLWGASCLRLGVGGVLSLIGYALLRRLRSQRPAAPAPDRRHPTPARQAAAEPAPPRTTRRRHSSGNGTTRRKKKAENTPAEPTAKAPPKKPRRSRRKKSELQQAELPL